MKAKYESPAMRTVYLSPMRLVCVSQIGEGSGEGDVKEFLMDLEVDNTLPGSLLDEEW